MCAIAGILDLWINDQIIKDLLETMKRRGPDDNGAWISDRCALLHSRLAIIDPDRGKQPMSLSWEDEIYHLSYNGELYNTSELRNELRKLGHVFTSDSDTEVLLHSYAQWKACCLEKLNGIFAFAVWHEREEKLFLARDRMGVKPLFYKHHERGLLFASEIKTILSYPNVEAKLDGEGIAQIILLGPGRIPGSGVFCDIYELEPGWYAEAYKERFVKRQYWKLTDGEHTDSFSETVEKVGYLVTDAIRRQMISDVPLGTFLSGGLDSSLISAVCADQYKKDNRKLHTFSVDYRDNIKYFRPGKFQPNSDGEYIKLMSGYINSEHHWTVLEQNDLINVLELSTQARDLPGMGDVDFSLFAFCKQIREHVKVALSGECADEIFGGYPWYRDPEIRAMEGFPWAQNTKYRASFLNKDLFSQIDPEAFVQNQYHHSVAQCDISPENSPEERRMKEMVNLNHRWFMQTLLDRKDRMSMFHGLEVRVPFCDYRIAEYLYRVPWKMKDYMGKEKGLLRHAMAKWLPDEVLWRKKSPYPKTWHPAYLDLVASRLREVLDNKNAPIHNIMNTEALEKLLTVEYSWPWYGQLMKQPQTIAYVLQVDHWMKHYHISLV